MKITLTSVLMLFFLCCNLLSEITCQTYHYSRGWTNGKRSSAVSMRDCQLHRLRSILDGKPLPQAYWPCEVPPYFEIVPSAIQQRSIPQELSQTEIEDK